MAKQTERIIFRREYDPYMKMWKYLAVFPDDPASYGRINATPFYKNGDNWWFEPYTEVSVRYYYDSTKIIHRKDPVISDLLKVIENHYGYTHSEVVDFSNPDEEEPVYLKVCEKLRPEDWCKRLN